MVNSHPYYSFTLLGICNNFYTNWHNSTTFYLIIKLCVYYFFGSSIHPGQYLSFCGKESIYASIIDETLKTTGF
jgi:hypothetical protein